MRVSDFDYSLPPELIAQQPVEPRDAARMLILARASEPSRVGRASDGTSPRHGSERVPQEHGSEGTPLHVLEHRYVRDLPGCTPPG